MKRLVGKPAVPQFENPSADSSNPSRIPPRLMLALCLFAAVSLGFEANIFGQSRLPVAAPETVSLESADLEFIDAVVHESLGRSRMPGCVVAIGHGGHLVWRKAYGLRQREPAELPMTVDTLFDLASLTKPIATATSVMKLVETGKIELQAPVSRYIPEFAQNGKQDITIYQLLTHQSGLLPDNALSDYNDGSKRAMERIWELSLRAEPGSKFIYTDVGFIVLAEVVRLVSDSNVHEFSQREIFQPLGMQETGYVPNGTLKQRAATTEQREGRWMIGEVHDPRAYRLDGIAGHAGLFSTADDLAVYAQMMLNQGQFGETRVLKPETVDLMTRGYQIPNGIRGLGWDKRTAYSSNRGDLMSPSAFGHGGFTGTGIWIDPDLDLFVIFLSNRVHPDGEGYVNPTIGRIGTIAAAAVRRSRSSNPSVASAARPETTPVLNGIDVLQRDQFQALKGQRVGLITNQTGRNRDGRTTIRLLMDAENVDVRCLFSPEHGLEGKLDIARIDDTQDTKTGLKVFSLYGKTRQPTAEMLAEIDTLVFDIQDIGTRFYTYISTMGLAMQAAGEHGKRFVVLDRVNPIGGIEVQGPVLDAGSESFVGFHQIPVRHGMTAGELALMIKAERGWDVELQVIRCQHWQRSMFFDEANLTWINPSPNMRSLTQSLLYPGVGLIETTNVSVGRGTDTPFELIGAPWIDGRQLAAALNGSHMPGVRCVPIRFTPESSKHANQVCEGVNFVIVDRSQFDPLRLGFELAIQLRRLYADQWDVRSLNRLLGHEATRDRILAGESYERLLLGYQSELAQFLNRRTRFLQY